MTNPKDTVKQDNRKNFPRFLLITVGCALLGGVLGFLGAMFFDEMSLETIRAGIQRGLELVSPWGIPVSGVLLLGPGFGLYRRAAARFAVWEASDEEDQDTVEIELWLSWALLLSNLALLFGMFFLATSFLCPRPMGNAALFLVLLVLQVALQQRVVDLTRRMNPEKKGSIYDTKFQKRWLESCDEAERAQIGQASYHAFTVTSTACGIIWLVMVLLHFLVGENLMAVLAVLVVWGILQVSYMRACIRMTQHSRREK